MGKNKLKKFAEMDTFRNVFQCGAREVLSVSEAGVREVSPENEVVKMVGHWRERYFQNENPIVLELGCGHGEYTVGLAQKYPNKNFIGVDIKGARMWVGAKQAETAGMKNVAFLRTNIEMVESFFDTDEIDEIWITFPDPQMKKATKRLTSTYFMQRYQHIVREGGLIHLKTDSPFLYTYTREMLRLNGYPVLADTCDLYNKENETAKNRDMEEARMLQTHYEKQWLDRGLTIKYLCWELARKENFEEPEIEIEKDSYRSYGRNYVAQN